MAETRFPGDPRFERWISPSREELIALSKKDFLSTNLLDCLLQRTAPPPEGMTSSRYHIGSLGTLTYMQGCNGLIPRLNESTPQQRADRAKVGRVRKTMKSTFTAPTNRLLIPVILNDHFFVLCLDCSFAAPEFVLDATLYDSLRRRTRQINPEIALIAKEVNVFLRNFVLHDDKHERLRIDTETFLRRLQYSECPGQMNGYDCGLFAVGVVLHLVEGKDIARETFNQQHITELRVKLASFFLGVDNVLETTSQVVRKCFPQLSGSSILESTGVEMISAPSRQLRSGRLGVELAAATAASTRRLRWETDVEDAVTVLTELAEGKTTTSAQRDVATLVEGKVETKTLLKGSVVKLVASSASDDTGSASDDTGSAYSSAHESDDNEDRDEDGVEEECDYVTESLTAGSGDKRGSSVSDNLTDSLTAGSGEKRGSLASASDTLLYEILKEANVECFATLEDATPFVEAYEVRSGNHLRVQRSLTDKFKQYQCREHVDCPFQILISRRKSDGMFGVSKIKAKHSDARRPARAADGRQWKKRRQAKLDGIIGQVVRTKHGVPVPADVVKTAATSSGMVLDYMTAYRALTHETTAARQATVKNFEMIIPFLEAMKSCNSDSVIGYTRDNDMRLVELHVFPGIRLGAVTLRWWNRRR